MKRNPPQKRNLLAYERRVTRRGKKVIAGTDEAGRGCLAGPVVAASVILPYNLVILGIDDSKKLSASKREELYSIIINEAISWSIAFVGAAEIDRINILEASLLAMRRAIDDLSVKPDYILVDGNKEIDIDIPQEAICHGDSLSQSIAASSIIAKVSRDRLMVDLAKKYPNFNFARHKGYGTPEHLRELKTHGFTEIHRRTFKPVRQLPLF